MPRVTVICATYNRSNVLPYSIGSVIGQSYSDWELLVVGDACTDDSAQVVARITNERGEHRVRWINLVPGTKNQYGPNNEGLRQARGELIAYIGHDDLWLPHHLECLVAAIDAGADVAHSLAFLPREDGLYLPSAVHDVCSAPSATMHRRALTEQLGGWRDYRQLVQVPQDELWDRLRGAGARFVFVPRLSVLKIVAGQRQNVYQTQPDHEQKLWAERIARQPDLETQILVALARHSFAAEQTREHSFGFRALYHWKRMWRGQWPRFTKFLPGDTIRRMNQARGVHQKSK